MANGDGMGTHFFKMDENDSSFLSVKNVHPEKGCREGGGKSF
jgi:hypothetical protein